MSSDRIHLQHAKGRVVLTGVHLSPKSGRAGLESFNVMRWRDEEGAEGQDSVARLVNYIRGGGEVGVEVDGRVTPVEAAQHKGYVFTRGASPEADPILSLPTFENSDE